jgi:adenosyl cobinamide kinase/adenosyl cobinamide phosphate guanylyltransferase
MVLVIGGRASGKREYVKAAYGYGDADMSDDIADSLPVVYDLQRICHTRPGEADAIYEAAQKKAVVICDEIGSGVVPIDIHERRWRDECGRLCARLAASADTVVRVTCGIGVTIKG